ncbi:NAF1-domain-containing protein [Phellopilus nigrolimitatus]|nr:NAF1-domain-containing protein [Phellopilus nigrolimitatus]
MFKTPSAVAQDLLLIQDLISEPGSSSASAGEAVKDSSESSESIGSSCASSDSETDSEEVNVVEELLVKPDTGEGNGDVKLRSPSPSSSESSEQASDSDSDSESDKEPPKTAGKRGKLLNDDSEDDEDEEGGARAATNAVLRTKNEVPELSIVVPDIIEVDAHEPLEKVGEIMGVIDNVVIVKGLASQIENRASERALDTESLLVFEDRKVLGYIHETFGPTHQPLYQVKFPTAASIDKEIATISRPVFHIPPRSNFVFPSQLRKLKGSDASNVHDEEINDEEVEFSDDEAEAAYKQQRRRQRESHRESSISSSRLSTPTPSQMHDDELFEETSYGTSPYDKYGPYDMDVVPGPSRPAPLPYDDPYQDGHFSTTAEPSSTHATERRNSVSEEKTDLRYDNPRGRGRGRGRGRDRGRGRGRDGGRDQRGRGGYGGGSDRKRLRGGGPYGGSPEPQRRRASFHKNDVASSSMPRSLSPTSLAIAKATGQYADGSSFADKPVSSSSGHPPPIQNDWQQRGDYVPLGGASQFYSNQMYQQHQQQPYVQPHINPRFASAFGIDLNFMQTQQYTPFNPSGTSNGAPYAGHQNASWVNNGWSQNVPRGNPQPSTANEFAVQVESEPQEYHP